MFSYETQKLIIKLLLLISKKEKEVEINRQILAQNPYFDIYQLFCFMDREKKNYIDTFNIMDFFHRNAVYPNKLEVDFIILSHDEDEDNKLSYSEFLNMIISQKNICLRKITRERIGYSNNKNNIPYEVDHCLLILLEKEIDFIRSISNIIKEIKEKKDFNIHNIFHLLIGYQYITEESLTNFLNKNYINFNEDDIKFIMKRMDFNKDGKVNFQEFHTFFCFNDPNCNCPLKTYLKCCLCSDIKNKYPNLNLNFNYNGKNCNEYNDCININYKYNYNKNNTLIDNYSNDNIHNISNNLSLRDFPERYSQYNDKNNYNKFLDLKVNEFNSKINNHFSPNENCKCCCYVCQTFPCRCLEIGYEKGELFFLNYLKECIDSENKIEKAKIDLSLRSDFNIEDAFKIFEKNNRNYITDDDLINGLNLLDININDKDIKLIKRRLNKKPTDDFIYTDFINLFIPYETHYKNMVENRIGSNYIPENKTDVFLLNTKNYFINLIKTTIECEKKIESLRGDLLITRNQIGNIFKNIDRTGSGSITDVDLYNFLRTRNINSNDNECCLLFIRLDKNKDGKVECWELNEELEYTI